MVEDKWKKAEEVLSQVQGDVSRLAVDSFQEEDHYSRKSIASPIPGFQFEVETSWMLNGSWVVTIEAERSYIFGLMYRSIFKHIVISPESREIPDRFGTRIETFHARNIRRNWGREDEETDDV